MNPILLQLYNGELHPRAEAEQPRVDMFTHRREYFCKHLTDKAPELETKFNAIMDDLFLDYTTGIEEAFLQGFSLAVRLMAAGLAYSPLS